MYAVLLFHAIYILFLKFAIWLPASLFWKMQEHYTQVLGRDFLYLIKSSLFLWGCAVLPIRFASPANHKYYGYIFWVSLVAFCFLDMGWLNMHKNTQTPRSWCLCSSSGCFVFFIVGSLGYSEN